MSLTRPPSVRYLLLLFAVSVTACAGSVKPPRPAPVPVSAPKSRTAATPRPESPPGTRGGDATAAAADTAVARQLADETVTVLPSILGRGATPATPRGSASSPGSPATSSTRPRTGEPDQAVRIALALSQPSVRISATGDWSLFDSKAERPLGAAHSGDWYVVASRGGALTMSGPSGDRGSLRGALVARPAGPNSVLVFNGHRYRGDLLVLPSGGGLIVVNRVPIEQYLRGVVPLEIGVDRTQFESAAVQAQAIAARSYAYTRLDGSHPYDMSATVSDQVYGGMDAERAVADDAVEATQHMVLMYAGRIAAAPYHANSGGTTAAASEVWRAADTPYLISVSDRIPGSDRFYCQESPKFNWTRTLDRASLGAVLAKYLPQYAGAPRSGVGTVRSVVETGHTASGRVAGLTFVTDRGRFTVRGNDIRFVLRTPGGEVLPSTLFSFDASTDNSGHVAQLTIRGTGNGHGVGMDQWGAISRARAGQSYTTILQTYYPGTNIGPVL